MRSKGVLLVEDEPLIAYEIESLLVDHGYRVVSMASSLKEALRAAEMETADVALLDVNIEGQSILPVADILSGRGIPFAFVTGYDRQDLPPAMTGAALVGKPISSEMLLRTVRTLTETPVGLA